MLTPEAQQATHASPANGTLKERTFDLSDWSQRGWATGHINHKEHVAGYWINVQGTIPPELTGTYYRNGPGTYKLGDQELAHPFDGHGFIISIAIKNGKAYARARFVETPEYESEVSQQKILFRGSFGTQRPGGARHNAFDIFMKNAANTSIVLWGGRLLALFEAAQPIAMDPNTLQTLGPDLLGGTVKPGASFHFGKVANRLSEGLFRALGIEGRKHGGESKLGGEAVTAHPRYDPDTGRLVFFKFQIRLSLNPLRDGPALLSGKKLPLKTVITFFELDKDGNEVCRLEHQTPGYTFLHDFALTPTHYVIVQNPVKLDPAPFLLGKSGHRVCEVEPGFVFHQGNSYYDPDTNCMVIICVRYDEFPDFSAQAATQGRSFVEVDMALQPVPQIWRYDINMTDGRHQQQCLCRRAFEFPSVHPAFAGRKTRYIYGGAALHPTRNMPAQSVARYDLETGHMRLWSKGSHYFMGEPQFIPRFDAKLQRSELVLLDAADIEAGPIAVLPLASPVGYGIHGTWVPVYHGP
ncbi:hypothetical protein WJX82_008309 [Trebouxia sp. C0006]